MHRHRAAVVLLLGVSLLLLGQWLASRPPRWLRQDPLVHPFGLDEGEESSSLPAKDAAPAPVTAEDPIVLAGAELADLIRLPGVGPVLAARILAHRDSLGGLTQLQQLDDVKGIGPRTLERLAPLVRFTEVSAGPDSSVVR